MQMYTEELENVLRGKDVPQPREPVEKPKPQEEGKLSDNPSWSDDDSSSEDSKSSEGDLEKLNVKDITSDEHWLFQKYDAELGGKTFTSWADFTNFLQSFKTWILF